MVVPLLLLCIWIYLAYGSWTAGRPTAAVIFLAIGIALTVWRLKRTQAKP